MWLLKPQEDNGFRSELVEQDRMDIAYNQNRYRSVSSSRLSGRLSQRSSVRDEAQTLDEFLRKQRVIRYMEEERERAARTTILRDEHDVWNQFRTTERTERLQYLSEQEIEALYQREAEEALKEKNSAKALAGQGAEKAILRRRGLLEIEKSKDQAGVPRLRDETETKTFHMKTQHDEAEKQALLSNLEEARQASVELRCQEAELIAECKQLKDQLSEARETAIRAVRDRERAEKELAKQMRYTNEGDVDTDGRDELQKRVEVLTKQLADLHGKLALTEVDRKRLSTLIEEKNTSGEQLDQGYIPKAVKQRGGPPANLRVQEDMVIHNEQESNKLKQLQKKADDSNKKLLTLQRDLAAKERQIEQYKKQLSLAQNGSREDSRKFSQDMGQNSKGNSVIRKKAEEELIRLQNRLEKQHAELQLVKKEKSALQRELNSARENAPAEAERVGREMADRKAIDLLKRKVNNLLHDSNRDATTIQCLKNELQSVQEELKYETAARAKFEELAAQAVDRSGGVPKEEVLKLKQQLEESEMKLRRAHVEMEEANQKAQEEIQELKDWCARLRERQDKQMHDMELALRNIPEDSQYHTHNNQIMQVPDLRLENPANSRGSLKAQTSSTLLHQRIHVAAEHKTNSPEETAVPVKSPKSPHPTHQEVRTQNAISVERFVSEDPEPQNESDLPMQQRNSIVVKQMTEKKVERVSECRIEVSASKVDVPQIENRVTELKEAPTPKIKEAVEQSANHARLETPPLSHTKPSDTDETSGRIDMISNSREISHGSASVTRKAKRRHKSNSKCYCS